jgi:Fic family protein
MTSDDAVTIGQEDTMEDSARPAPKVLPYKPFPDFATWVEHAGYEPRVFDRFESQLMAAKDAATPEALRAALQAAMKWAAVDTGAIEGLYEVDRGFTYSVALEAAAWDSIHLTKGVEVARAIEDAMQAYEGVLDAATNSEPITEAWIRELHATICASQDTYTVYTEHGIQQRELVKGAYKTDPNSPLNLVSNEVHSYAPPSETPIEMHRLIEEMRTPLFMESHPALQASYMHYAFVCVHPFADGNGRVARALASVFLYRRPGLPLVVFADQKPAYIDALEAADKGSYSSFVWFVADRVIDTVAMVRDDFLAAQHNDIDQQLVAIRELLTGRGGLEHAEVDAAAERLLEEFQRAVVKATMQDNSRVSFYVTPVQQHQARVKAPTDFRRVTQGHAVQVQVQSQGPGASVVDRQYAVVVARPEFDPPDFAILRNNEVITDAFLRDVHPAVSQALSYRLDGLARREVVGLLAELERTVEQQLGKLGYR